MTAATDTGSTTARLRQAAGVVRGWVAEAGDQPWAPGAVAAFGPELAAVFESWAWMGEYDAAQLHRVGGPETLALADAILAGVTP